MAWTSVTKPSTQNYTTVNPMGKEQYDQASLTYDDMSTFYDGVNMSQWTNVSKPTNGNATGGMATGLLIPLTRSTNVVSDPWTYVPKPQ